MLSFSDRVYMAVSRIPKGRVSTYKTVAYAAGSPKAVRAVGNILHKNPFPVTIPCHRVVHSDGTLCNAFAFGGIGAQKALLEAEGVTVRDNKVDLDIFEAFLEEVK